MKQRRLFLWAFLAAWALAPWAHGGGAASPQSVFTLRAISPHALAQKTLESAEAIELKVQLQLFYLFKFGAFGYPAFADFDAEAPVTLRVFENPTSKGTFAVLFAKLSPHSALEKHVGDMRVRRMQGGWTAVDIAELNDPGLLARAAAAQDVAELAVPPDCDITLRVHPYFHDRMALNLANDAAKNALSPNAQKLIGEIAQELRDVDELWIGADFAGDEVTLRAAIRPKAGTPLSALFSAPSGGDIPMARAMPDDAPLAVAFKANPAALEAYSDHLFNRFQKHFDGVQADALENTRALARAWMRTHEGGFVSNYALLQMTMESETVYDGYCDPAVLKALLERTQEVGNFIGDFAFSQDDPVSAAVRALPPLPGQQTPEAYGITFTAKKPPELNPGKPGSMLITRAQIAERFAATVKGTQIAATREDALRALETAIWNGNYPEKNLHGALELPLSDGTFLRGRINAPVCLRDVFFYQSGSAKATPLSYALEKLADTARLPPVVLRGTNGAGRAEFECVIPLETAKAVIQTVQQSPSPSPAP